MNEWNGMIEGKRPEWNGKETIYMHSMVAISVAAITF